MLGMPSFGPATPWQSQRKNWRGCVHESGWKRLRLSHPLASQRLQRLCRIIGRGYICFMRGLRLLWLKIDEHIKTRLFNGSRVHSA
jgi:hypothetical protein